MHVYVTPERDASSIICQAFADGSQGQVIESRLIQPGPCAFWGSSKFTHVVLDAARARGQDFFYIDNGYLSPGHYDGYYRVTKNEEQHDGVAGEPDYDRLDQHNVTLDKWGQTGRHILLIVQSRPYYDLRGMRQERFIRDTVSMISQHTARPVIVRMKPTGPINAAPLHEVLDDAHAVVSYSSNVAIEAMIRGIKSISLRPVCAAQSVSTPFEDLETEQPEPDRRRLLGVLANNQWTLDEMRSGKCRGDLHEKL